MPATSCSAGNVAVSIEGTSEKLLRNFEEILSLLSKTSDPSIRAFTLVELLMVIAVIGVLTWIIVPVIGKSRESAQKAQCASNLRQIGRAIHLFAMDNRGPFPLSTRTVRNVEESWRFNFVRSRDAPSPLEG